MPVSLPKISIITPSLNQAVYIEECIQSVLSQDYPCLEYFVLDGGSTDGTHQIVNQYLGRLTFISEKDDGQVDAINKGLRMCTGDIVAYLNSDDTYLPGALLRVGEFFAQNPAAMAVTGKCKRIDDRGAEINRFITIYKNLWLSRLNFKTLLLQQYISQPSTFWRRDLLRSVGYFDPAFRYAMDYDYWLRIFRQTKIHYIDEYLACFRIHSTSITGQTSHKHLDEEVRVARSYAPLAIHVLHKMINSLSAWIFQTFYRRTND
jgi:glycosyltransferase involved in cell wall biosynthesis